MLRNLTEWIDGSLHRARTSTTGLSPSWWSSISTTLPSSLQAHGSTGHHHQVPALPPAQSSGARVSLRLPGGPRLSRPLRSGSCLHLPLQLHHRLSPRSLFKLAEVSARGLGKLLSGLVCNTKSLHQAKRAQRYFVSYWWFLQEAGQFSVWASQYCSSSFSSSWCF